MAINASKTAKFVYDLGNNGGAFFLEGTINGSPKVLKATSIRSGDNKAVFSEVDFASGDIFEVKEFYNTDLYVHGATSLTSGGSGNTARCFEDNNGKIALKASKDGNYSLYLNTSDKLYTEDGAPYGVHNSFFIAGSMNSWSTNNANYEMYNDRSNKAVSDKIHFNVDDEFKVVNDGTWYGWPSDNVSTDIPHFSGTSVGSNIKCVDAGWYIVYVNNSGNVWVSPTSAPAN